MRSTTLLLLTSAALSISCGGASRGTTVVAVPNTPVAVDTSAPPEPSSDHAPGTVRDRASRLLSKHVDFDSAKRLEINKQFPGAEKIKDNLVRIGAPWTEDDWFGEDPPDHWEVKIGVDVGVPAAQAVIAACALHSSAPFRVILMTTHGVFENHRRIYVGALDTKNTPLLAPQALLEMLKPGLTSERLRALVGRIEGPNDGEEDGD